MRLLCRLKKTLSPKYFVTVGVILNATPFPTWGVSITIYDNLDLRDPHAFTRYCEKKQIDKESVTEVKLSYSQLTVLPDSIGDAHQFIIKSTTQKKFTCTFSKKLY